MVLKLVVDVIEIFIKVYFLGFYLDLVRLNYMVVLVEEEEEE